MSDLFKDILSITLSLLKLPVKIVQSIFQRLTAAGIRRLVLGLLISIVLIAVAATVFFEATSQPEFCISCHYMKPYFASWKMSNHKDVHCTKCHITPGLKGKIEGKFTALSMLVNYATGIYKRSKPWAEINDENCLQGGCHQTRLMEGRVQFKEGIIFDHKPHLTQLRLGKKLRCTSCHSQMVQGEHIAVTTSTCFICHFKGADNPKMSSCTNCHDAPVRNATTPDVKFDHTQMLANKVSCNRCHGSMMVGSGDVPKERCNSCHAELGKINRFDDVTFIHDNHITKRKVDCQACHQTILHQSVSRTQEVKPSCEDCHVGFHQVQVAMFTGQGGKGVDPNPSTMFQSGLNCRGCHMIKEQAGTNPLKGVTFKATGEVCAPCHDQGYDKILEGWKKRNAERLSQIRGIERSVKGALSGVPSFKAAVADSLLSAAGFNIGMVEDGHGIHNIPYSESLLGTAYTQLKAAYAVARPGSSLAPFEIGMPNSGANCMNCHYGIETIAVQRAGRTFPHAPHVLEKKLACTTCHSNDVKHGQLILDKSACNTCHHKGEDGKPPECVNCHQLQASIYKGDASWGEHSVPEPMYEANLTCADCHNSPEGGIQRPTGQTCVGCHDESYAKLLSGWEDEFRAELVQVDSLLHLCRNVDLPDFVKVKKEVERIEQDRSHGVHNHAMIDGKLAENRKWLTEFVNQHGLGIAPPTPPNLLTR